MLRVFSFVAQAPGDGFLRVGHDFAQLLCRVAYNGLGVEMQELLDWGRATDRSKPPGHASALPNSSSMRLRYS